MRPEFHPETIAPAAAGRRMSSLAGVQRGSRRPKAWLSVLICLAAGLGCFLAPGPEARAQTPAQQQPMPDFLLRDANSNSSRYTRMVSPRDYRLQISAYYFGDAG